MIKKIIDELLGQKINGVRITPTVTKILSVFAIFIVVANLTTNYFNLEYSQILLTKLLKKLLVKDLQEIYTFSNNQYEIYQYTKKIGDSYSAISKKGLNLLEQKNSIILGIQESGNIAFQASKIGEAESFDDIEQLKLKTDSVGAKSGEGKINFKHLGKNYYGVYKFHPKWNLFILRAEETGEFYAESNRVFFKITIIILFLTFFCSIIGLIVMRELLKFISTITQALMLMNKEQQLSRIQLDKAPVDQITYLGMSFNALSDTISNLLNIFRKFVSDDLAEKVYKEKNIRLEGTKRELTMLFTDIKQFTFITETLGTDIIQLLNIHYNKAIRDIIEEKGIIGSIIGDSLLAVYGTLGAETNGTNKSFQAVISAYKIVDSTSKLRMKMHQRREEILNTKGSLSEQEEKIYRAVLLEVGVGIDCGEVFYGNIGSYEQMTNTVIGDRVNSASRLEGLTRIYKVPVIVSDSVKEEIEHSISNHGLQFVEIDLVQVKGKTEGRKIYWPIFKDTITAEMEQDLENFQKGLELYYAGEWTGAMSEFNRIKLPIAEEFVTRTQNEVPNNWRGVWAMTTK